MNQTVLSRNHIVCANPIKRKLKVFCVTAFILTILFAVVLIVFQLQYTHNFDGQTRTVNIVVSDAKTDEGICNITDADGNRYLVNLNIVQCAEEIDFETLVGANVTFIVPQNPFGTGNTLVLGMEIDGKTVIDYHTTLQLQQLDYAKMKTALIVMTSIAGGLSLALLIWTISTPAAKVYELTDKFAEYCALRQPSCPQRRASSAWMIIAAIVFFIIACVGIALSGKLNREWILDVVFGLDVILLTATLIIIKFAVAHTELKFYRQHYPFDYTDISHLNLRKNIKEQLQQEINAQYLRNPHRYGDGGNGFAVEFTAEGINLYAAQDNMDETATPAAEDVFDMDIAGDDARQSAENANKPLCSINYDKCNWLAQAHYRVFDHSFAIVIHTRLPQEEFDIPPARIANDINIPVDTNLLNTLQTFDVQVENLQYLLDNKDRLMQQNCKLSALRKKEKDNK